MIKQLSKILVLGVFAALVLSKAPVNAGETVPARSTIASRYTERVYLLDVSKGIPLNVDFVRMSGSGVGNGRHFGKHTIDFQQVVQLQVLAGKPTFVATGSFTVTTANGDTVTGQFTNYRLLNVQTKTPENHFTGASIYTGGTGRFAGASGQVWSSGEIIPDTVSGLDWISTEHEGFISSVGAAKH